MNKKFDIIVVGAGPAGSQAAMAAAKNGANVALIERKEWPSTPVRCGEGVGFKGMNASIGIDKKWILTEVTKVAFIAPSKKRVELSNVGESFCVDRTIMDRELVERAIDSGTTYINRCYIESVKVEKEGNHNRYICRSESETFEAPILIAADGVESRIKKFVGWSGGFKMEDMESCAIAKIKHPSIVGNTIEFYVDDSIAPGGYLWVFPRGPGVANIGLGVLGSRSKPGSSTKLLKKFVEKEFDGAEVYDEQCGGVPVAHWNKKLVNDGVLLVGDAAGQVNALNGGGIAYALFAGKVAGEVAASSFNGDEPNYKTLKRYQKEWNKYCGKNQARSYALKTALLKHRNSFFNSVADSFEGENMENLSYMKVFFRVFAKHPILLLKTFLLFR
jgi:digeranylgeranylglycerophospholipid reductase